MIIRISGTQGVGKTHLACTILSKYCSFPEYIEINRKLTKSDITRMRRGGVFFIDEAGPNEWDEMEVMMSGRRSNEKLVIIMETNRG